MNIKEAETVTGISKRNIRYYEQAGLICPTRNRENDYREYTETDINTLKLIRALRMIDMPLEQIKEVIQGKATLHDAASAHKQTLLVQKRRVELAIRFCDEFRNAASSQDIDDVLRKMDEPQNSKELFQKWFGDHKRDMEWILIRLCVGLIPMAMNSTQYVAGFCLGMLSREIWTLSVYLLVSIPILIVWGFVGYGMARTGNRWTSFALCHAFPFVTSLAAISNPNNALLWALYTPCPAGVPMGDRRIPVGDTPAYTLFGLYLMALAAAFLIGVLVRQLKENRQENGNR